jgi:hypothetical protein
VRHGQKGRFSGRSNIALIAGLMFLATPTTVAFQDIASLISGGDSGANRWQSILKPSAAGSIQQAEMPFDASLTTGSIDGAGIEAPGIGKIAFTAKGGRTDILPDEDRINRAEKKGRIVGVTKVAPPKAFNAGSIMQRTSSLLRPTLSSDLKMAFVKSDIKGREIKLALEFHVRQPVKTPRAVLPVMIAELADDKAITISAAAYAPVEPDYARESPFESLLKSRSRKARAGRSLCAWRS